MLVDDLITKGEKLFNKRTVLLGFWQEIAENFYPERADFLRVSPFSGRFMDYLTTSYPIMVRRDLGNAFGSMLRPTAKSWFHIRTSNYDKLSLDAKRWLEHAEDVQRRQMYRRSTQFLRAMKEGDHDYATFGQSITSVSLTSDRTSLLYRTFPLSTVAWCENADGVIDTVVRKSKMTCATMCQTFPGTVHNSVQQAANQDPYKELDVWHFEMPSDQVDGADKRFPVTSVYIDVENRKILEQVSIPMMTYNIARWQTMSNTQYAFSPATMIALPDARLLQAMSRLLLEAGEKAVSPPMLATKDAIRSDINIYAGGVTWVSAEYDERLGDVLRPLTQDRNGIPLGIDLQRDTRAMLAEAFYLSKLNLPEPGPEMTAYEVGQRVQEYIRQALPLFEPTEQEINGGICERTFATLLRNNAFGPLSQIPPDLAGSDISFEFESPLHDAIEREKGQRMMEARDMIATAMQLDPNAGAVLDPVVALRDVLMSIGTPLDWIRSESDVNKIMQNVAQQQAIQQQLQNAAAAAGVAKTGAEAEQAMPS